MAVASGRPKKKRVLFVCLGNICRSPIAEGVFRDLIKKEKLTDKWFVDSAALIDFHLGKAPDKRTLEILTKHGITDYKHRARQVTDDDFHTFDYILGMDDDNIQNLRDQKERCRGKAIIDYLGKHDPQGMLTIPDPYYSRGMQTFEQVYDQCFRSCEAFLKANR